MAKGHRSKLKRERNAENRETRPHAKLSYARVTTRKACYVLNAIRGMGANEAVALLKYNRRYASEVILKILNSAIANAENNMGLDRKNLYIAHCVANQGPTMKRIQPRAQGRAYRIEKRMSHIEVVLDEVKEGK